MESRPRKVIIVHGGPRKGWNTATLLDHAAAGAEAEGAVVERVDLYDLDFKGCRSCLACKARNGRSRGRCAQQDALRPVLERVLGADGLILGSPIYFGSVTGAMRAFLERLLFPLFTYTDPPASLAPRPLSTACVYTMNLDEQEAEQRGYWTHLGLVEGSLARIFGHVERLAAFDTLQADPDGDFEAGPGRWDPARKVRRRQAVFPGDCASARALGSRVARGA